MTHFHPMPKLGIIAGNRTFPLHVAQAAKAKGYEVVAVGLKEETAKELEEKVDRMHWVSIAQVGSVPELLKGEGIQEVILAGQIKPERLLQRETQFDPLTRQLLKILPDRSGSSAMRMAVQFLEAQGFRVLDSSSFLKEWIPSPGVLTTRNPSPEEEEDLRYGLRLAQECARLSIGQMVVVRHKTVVAVEAMEGTDKAIVRAGQIAGEGCVVVKACEAGHDMRFDIPVVGPSTLSAMEESRARCLGVEARRTLLFERPNLIRLANEKGIAVVAL